MGDLRAGDRIAEYRVLRLIGRGGSSSTYEVEDTQSRRFALKRLDLGALSDWKQYELFEREARVLANLTHDSIPRYVAHFQLESPPGTHAFYLVQELAPGRTLAEWIAAGWRPDEADAKHVVVQLLGILAYLQSLHPPLIHRDIKPQNVLRTDDGRIFLVDFGAVRDTYRTLTGGTTIVGTFGYMAPEQLRGVALPATDVYGVAGTLLFLLTGAPPTDLPQARLKPDFRRRARASGALLDWIDRAIEPSDADRFPDAATALRALRDGPKRAARRSGLRAVLVLATLGLLVPPAAWVFFSTKHHAAAAATIGGAGRPAASVAPLPARPSDGFWAIWPKPVKIVPAHQSALFAVAVSPDGKRIATGSNDFAAKVWDRATGKLLGTLGGLDGPVHSVSFLPDGTRAVVSGGTRIVVFDVATRKPTLTISGADPSEVIRAVPSPDGRLVAANGKGDSAVKLWDLSTGKVTKTLAPEPKGRAFAVTFSPDGARLAAGGDDRTLRVWDVASGKLLGALEGHSGAIDSIAFAPDGQTMLTASDDRTLKEWRLPGGAFATLGGHTDEVWAATVSPKGDFFVSGGKDGMLRVWDAALATMRFLFKDGLHDASDTRTTAIAFFPDGSGFVTAGTDGTFRIWAVPGQATVDVPPPSTYDPPAVSASPTTAEAVARGTALIEDQRGDHADEVEALARAALKKDQASAAATALLGRAILTQSYRAKEKTAREALLADATKLIDQSLTLDPNLAAAHVQKGWWAFGRKDYEAAAREAHLADANKPGSGALLLAEIAYASWDADEAVAQATRGFKLPLSRGRARQFYPVLEKSLDARGDFDAVESVYKAEIALFPDDVWPKGNYADFLERSGMYTRANDEARKALSQSDYPAARAVLSSSYAAPAVASLWDRGNAEQARAAFDLAVRANGRNGLAHYGLGAYYRQLAVTHGDQAAAKQSRSELSTAVTDGFELAKKALEECDRVDEAIKTGR